MSVSPTRVPQSTGVNFGVSNCVIKGVSNRVNSDVGDERSDGNPAAGAVAGREWVRWEP